MATNNLPIAHARAQDIRSIHSFIWKPDVLEELYTNYGDGLKNGVDILRSLGRFGMIGNDTFTHHEENYDLRTVTVGASNIVVSSNPGDPAYFELHADDLDDQDNHICRLGYTLTLGSTAAGFIEAQIADISGTTTITIKITPWDSTATISGTYLFDGAELAIGGGAFAPETDQPAPTTVGFAQRTHYTQIFKETLEFGGAELASQTWHPVLNGGGWFNKELSRGEFLLDRQLEYALIMGQANTNSLTGVSDVTGSNNPITKNKGLWTWGTELGYSLNYTDTNSIAMTDLDDAAAYYESVGVNSGIVMVLCGGGYYRRVENTGNEFISNPGGAATQGGGLPGDFLSKARNSKMPFNLNFGFRAIQKSGITFVFHSLPIFNNPYQFGISGYLLNDAAIMVPLTTVNDPVKSTKIPNIQGRARAVSGYSRERVVGLAPGMDGFIQQRSGQQMIQSIDANATYWLSEVGFPVMEAFKLILHKRSA
jgi:hypothetical protein